MSKSKIFDDDSLSEYEQIESDLVEPSEEAMDEILEEYEEEEEPAPKAVKSSKSTVKSAYNMNAAETDIMSAAIVQLEQAKLYDMFLKHNLFGDIQCNPTARKRVEKELKDFILERMQILLGMKEEKKAQREVQHVKVELPFNDVEIEFLKALSLKGTGGASANAKPAQVRGLSSMKSIESKEDEEETPQSLKSIGQSLPRKLKQPEPEYEEEEEELAPVIKKRPLQAVKKTNKIIVTDEEVAIERKRLAKTGAKFTDAEIRAAKEDIKRMSRRTKPAHLMNEDELRTEAKKNAKEKIKPAGALPMPSSDQQVAHYMTQQMQNQIANPDNSALMGLLSQKLGFSTTGVHTDNGTGDE